MPDLIFPDKPKRPPFDPELVPVLERAREVMSELGTETLPEFRRMAAEGPPGTEPVDLTADGAVHIEERQIPGPDGAPDLTVLILRPAQGTGPWPGIYFIHGGGMIAGISAGGGLAAGTALLARDRDFPELSHQILVCPMLDDRLTTHSTRMMDGDGGWDRNRSLFGWTALLGERRGGPDVSVYAAPARAKELDGLPRTYIDVGSVEPFRDEALDYAGRLSEAGVNVDLHMWGGGFHGFDGVAKHAAISQAANATREEFVRRALEY